MIDHTYDLSYVIQFSLLGIATNTNIITIIGHFVMVFLYKLTIDDDSCIRNMFFICYKISLSCGLKAFLLKEK